MAFPQNAYPNFTNFPYPSFPQEVTPPDSDSDAGEMICVTYSRSWTAVLLSACSQLTQLSSWIGTDDEKKLAVQRATNLQWQLQNDIGCDMGCCYDTVARRITSSGDMQISVNGGDWVSDPNDPRATAPTYPPITFDENHTKCDAASNAAEHINDVIAETSSQLGGTGSIIEIAAAICVALFALFLAPETIPALAPVILPLVGGLIFLGQAAWDAYFSSDVHDKILCALFCNIGDDGTFTADQYTALISDLTSKLPASPARDLFVDLVARIGLVGINDYAAIGTSADADCSSCDCGCGDLHYFIVAGTLVSQTVNEDGDCVLVIDSAFTGTHDDMQVNWNFSSSPVLGHVAQVLHPVVCTLPIGGGGDCVFPYYWSPTTNVLTVSSTSGEDCGTAMLFESNLTGGGHSFRTTLIVSTTEPGCP